MQLGTVLTFDIRHTTMPLASLSPPPGVASAPVHSLVSLGVSRGERDGDGHGERGGGNGEWGGGDGVYSRLVSANFSAVVGWEPGGGEGGSQGPTGWQVRGYLGGEGGSIHIHARRMNIQLHEHTTA